MDQCPCTSVEGAGGAAPTRRCTDTTHTRTHARAVGDVARREALHWHDEPARPKVARVMMEPTPLLKLVLALLLSPSVGPVIIESTWVRIDQARLHQPFSPNARMASLNLPSNSTNIFILFSTSSLSSSRRATFFAIKVTAKSQVLALHKTKISAILWLKAHYDCIADRFMNIAHSERVKLSHYYCLRYI